MIRKSVFFVLILWVSSNASFSQQSACMTDFDFVVKKIRADYPGYDVKIRGDKVQELARAGFVANKG